jgi:hypothetical protein
LPQLSLLLEKMKEVEVEIEIEMSRRREELRFHFENRKILFEHDVEALQRSIKVKAFHYFVKANPLVMLTAPVIYSLLIPFLLVDLMVMAYQAICFPAYGIPKVRRRDYLVFDRHHLAYLNIIEKMNCAYCSYCTGVAAFVREVTARTEIYWCPIKHSRRILGPHPYYAGFADFGDAPEFQARMLALKDGVKLDIEAAAKADDR